MDEDIALMAIGPTGVGKSTIGNMIMTGSHRGDFKMSPGAESCTKEVRTRSVAGRSFTDVPGTPDTHPENTQDYYNKCIDAIKEIKLSALLVVFKMEKIDTEKYKLAELLYREIGNAKCMKFLIINDHNNYAFQRPDPAEYQKLATAIIKYTKIDFSYSISINASNMAEELEKLVAFIKSTRVQPIASPELRNFEELGNWVKTLSDDTKLRDEIIKTNNGRVKRRRIYNFGLDAIAAGGAASAPFALGITGVVTLVALGLRRISVRKISNLEDAIACDQEKIQSDMQELRRAKKHFVELMNAIAHNNSRGNS
eukprot:CAMPEP_0195291122 /NCGR_PEP_ID=MMETSP0707-20130614/7150_1 /TAXON_ID=33640 /ORGANISM="Asterionellopsis glacialis, Strain CCMP134" /LENGTH=311 /DNA_ID=CAMNT_0040351377 /DNA_START=49 /DNA_END=984 /DNA_ORIENTATION=-